MPLVSAPGTAKSRVGRELWFSGRPPQAEPQRTAPRLPPAIKTPAGLKFHRQSTLTRFKLELEAFTLGLPLPKPPPIVEPDALIPYRAAARQLGGSTRTLDRWAAEAKAAAETIATG